VIFFFFGLLLVFLVLTFSFSGADLENNFANLDFNLLALLGWMTFALAALSKIEKVFLRLSSVGCFRAFFKASL
jgi:hypothetical protein